MQHAGEFPGLQLMFYFRFLCLTCLVRVLILRKPLPLTFPKFDPIFRILNMF